MKAHSLFRILFLALGLVIGLAANAQDLGAVKARMAQRQGAVDTLKEKQLVGENNQGYLEARGSVAAADQQVVSAENADRGTVYAALAKQTGTTAEQVGRARAQKIAENSARGVWVQAPDGSWRQK